MNICGRRIKYLDKFKMIQNERVLLKHVCLFELNWTDKNETFKQKLKKVKQLQNYSTKIVKSINGQ